LFVTYCVALFQVSGCMKTRQWSTFYVYKSK